MLMLGLDLVIGPGGNDLPEHLGGALHGFVERAILNHAPHLMPVLRPGGGDDYASVAIEPPPFGMVISDQLRFGLILFRDATQSWSVIARALIEQSPMGLNQHPIQIDRAWIYEPGSPVQAIVVSGQLIDEPMLPESPAAWIRRVDLPLLSQDQAAHIHHLDFRSPLLLGARGAIRRTQQVPWPSLKSLLDSIAKRLLVLEPELATALAVSPGWQASEALDAVMPLTPAEAPAQQIQWPYAAHRGIFKPGIVGRLSYVAELGSTETALLQWGQWLGVGQQTTMGCGRYVWHPGASPKS